MSWIVMNAGEGPLIINELGINLTGKQHFDLDMIGRVNAERSNEVKLALQKGWLKQVRKDASAEGSAITPAALNDIKTSVAASVSASVAAGQQSLEAELAKTRLELEAAKKRQAEMQAEMLQKHDQASVRQDLILAELQKLSQMQPAFVETVKKAMSNIKIEQATIAHQREEIKESGASPEEIKAQEKILALKDKKLEKNYQDIGKSLSKNASNVDEALDALDELGV